MLAFSKSQMEAFDDIMRNRFVARLQGKVRLLFPDLEQRLGGADKFAETLGNIVARAEAYGVEEDLDIATFVALFCANHKLAASQPNYLSWTKPVLEREETSGDSKMGFIEHMLRKKAPTDPTAEALSKICTDMRQQFYV